MKKFLLLILTFILFSCSQENLENNNNNSWKTENISEEITLPDFDDEEFLNSQENKLNKEKAKECLAKVNKNNFDDTSYTGNIVQAFEYNWECYYLYISRLYYFPDTVFTTADIWKKVKYYEDAPYEVLVTIFDEIWPYDPTKPKRYYFETTPSYYLRSREFQPTNDDIPKLNYLDKRIHNEFCDNDDELQYSNLTYWLNLLINLDAIFEEYNIVPPRIIYS